MLAPSSASKQKFQVEQGSSPLKNLVGDHLPRMNVPREMVKKFSLESKEI